MKIQCDVCEKEEASVFCTADEASLCDGCDRRVHHANKLARKHARFSLLHPSFQDSPLCDICQERKAFLFCKEDRAILCRECDIPIHNANSHTKKHNRFLLSGVKLSASSSTYSSSYQTPSYSNGSSAACCTQETDAKSSDSSEIYNKPSLADRTFESTTMSTINYDYHQDVDSIATSSISEYLMETLPGWHVEDFLEPSHASHPYGYCKAYDGTMSTSPDPESNNFGSFLTGNLEIWGKRSIDLCPQSSIMNANNKKWIEEEECIVPVINPSLLKRQRQ